MMTRTSWPRLAALLLAIAGLACSDSSPVDPALDPDRLALEQNRSLFRTSSAGRYGYVYRNVCFCGDIEAVRIEVEDDVIVAVTRVADGAPVPPDAWERYLTIEEVFAVIEDALERPAERVDVTYDARLGYPGVVYIDYEAQLADEERGFEIGELTVR